MTTRTVSVVLLFFAALMTSAVALALLITLGQTAGVSIGRWTVPILLLITFGAIFFAGRQWLLPPAIAEPPLRAIGAIGAWVAVSMVIAAAITWAIRPAIEAVGFGPGAILVWLGCVLACAAVLSRFAHRAGR